MKPDEKPEIPPLRRCTCEPGKRLGVWVSAKSVLREPPEGECATCKAPLFWHRTKWMPVEQPETPVEQRQNVSEGDHSAQAVKAARSEIQGLYDDLTKKAEGCARKFDELTSKGYLAGFMNDHAINYKAQAEAIMRALKILDKHTK